MRASRQVAWWLVAPPCGEYLGRLQAYGLDIYENSPKPWRDALLAEQER